jgi:hypothetical protein
MQSNPAIKPVLKAAKSRFDEFQAYHINQADAVHVTVSPFQFYSSLEPTIDCALCLRENSYHGTDNTSRFMKMNFGRIADIMVPSREFFPSIHRAFSY